MPNSEITSSCPVIPGLRYEDAPAAIDWLCETFGFERNLVVPAEDGNILHAQLVFGRGMIMLGSAGGHGEFDEWVKPPRALGGIGSQSVYVVVADAEAHHDRAVARGAEIVIPLFDAEYGGRGYSCRDPEGNVWSFGTYDPSATD